MSAAMNQLVLCLALVLAGCVATSLPPPPPPTQGGQSSLLQTEVVFFENDVAGMKLHPDGSLEVKSVHTEPGKAPVETWHGGIKLLPDGGVLQDGKKVAQLQPDGTVTSAEGGKVLMKIEGNKLSVEEHWLMIQPNGDIVTSKPSEKKLRVQGASDAAAQRYALLALGILLA